MNCTRGSSTGLARLFRGRVRFRAPFVTCHRNHGTLKDLRFLFATLYARLGNLRRLSSLVLLVRMLHRVRACYIMAGYVSAASVVLLICFNHVFINVSADGRSYRAPVSADVNFAERRS